MPEYAPKGLADLFKAADEQQPIRQPAEATRALIAARKVRFQSTLLQVLSGPAEARTDLLQKAIDSGEI